MDAPLGTIVSFSTQSGQTAADGDGRNSPYTRAFLKYIEEPSEIGDVFRTVSSEVYETSGRSQLPELSLSIVGKFYLKGPLTINVAPAAPSSAALPCAAAETHWKAVESIGTVAAFEDHLSRFPSCEFGSLANARIDGLKQKAASATLAKAGSAAVAQGEGKATDFDGTWDVLVACAAEGKAAAYTRQLEATVKDGAFRADDSVTRKTNWLKIEGDIGKDGKALLNARGITGDAKFNVNQVKSGVPYAYTIDATFAGAKGSGKRNELRACTLTFAKR
jgi:hypothetical protein